MKNSDIFAAFSGKFPVAELVAEPVLACSGDQWILTARRYTMGLFAILNLLDCRGQYSSPWVSAWSQPGKLCEEQLSGEAEQAGQSQFLPRAAPNPCYEYPWSCDQALFFQHEHP